MTHGVVNVVETLAEYEFAMDDRHDPLREVKVDVILRRCWIIATSWNSLHCIQ